MSIIDKLRTFPAEEAVIYEASYEVLDSSELVLIRVSDTDLLATTGPLAEAFSGEEWNGIRLCPCTHENRLALNQLLPYTAPVAFGRESATFGFGDRLGFANPAQVRVVRDTYIRPVLAQQSLRELTLIGRDLPAVIDVAAWAVFREGYRRGYACDGDHLKTLEEVLHAVENGCSMVTLDCSLVLKEQQRFAAEWETFYRALPETVQAEDTLFYLENARVRKLGLHFTPAVLGKLHAVYDGVTELCQSVYENAILTADHSIDLEVSLDETAETTSPEAHYYVADRLERAGVFVTSIAPKFVGEFQKAIDYIGDTEALREAMALHAAVSNCLGHKLSLHSGSEKFTAMPILAELTGGRYHIKTSGTSWLEAVETIAKHAPALYRKMHLVALEGIADAKKHYEVNCDLQNILPLDVVTDAQLPDYLSQNDSRQLMHITYGYILSKPELKTEIFHFLSKSRTTYEAEVEKLYLRHLNALGIYSAKTEDLQST